MNVEPLGSTLLSPDRARFRVWAPDRKRVDLELATSQGVVHHSLEPVGGGYFEGVFAVSAGALYRYRVDRGESFPDPASRFQPEGPHGPSQVIDPRRYAWKDSGWKGLGLRGQVFYELHI